MKKVIGITDKVLKIAKEEFLKKGYTKASVRVIATKAGTATGSIYSRFGDKAGIFGAIVSPVINELETWFTYEQMNYSTSHLDKEWNQMLEYTQNRLYEFLDFVYTHLEIFKLLVKCSSGTEYHDFIHRISAIHADYTIKYLEDIGNNSMSSERVDYRLLHMLYNAQYSALFETVIYDVPIEDAKDYCRRLQDFFVHGWEKLFEVN